MAGYSGDAGDAMAAAAHTNYYANGRMFSCPGSDNDIYTSGNCADLNGGTGWWLGLCTRSLLNIDRGIPVRHRRGPNPIPNPIPNPHPIPNPNLGSLRWRPPSTRSLLNIDTDGIWTTSFPGVHNVQFSRMLVKLN